MVKSVDSIMINICYTSKVLLAGVPSVYCAAILSNFTIFQKYAKLFGEEYISFILLGFVLHQSNMFLQIRSCLNYI